ncbi:hypothetical protein [Paracoccus actinidiae]|uniref:hypothetical protein n=1 Tax=Paracoccus actinidiae TaxID=3064531 RepID=UPI0027D29779|nr:hypothetical protein [Paracoccus sp. M09]
MFHQSRFFTSALHQFILDHIDALQNASDLLGGRTSLRRTQRLISDIAGHPEITSRLEREIGWLHQLLTLQHVDDFDLDHEEYVAMLAPDAPYVDEICLLADGLEDAMIAAGLEPYDPLLTIDSLDDVFEQGDWT